jgi:very-short-patch-repair endonuclease
VLFLPNCRARIGLQGNRQDREADFLVCPNGKLGILEVDGESVHPPPRTAEDQERDRLFKRHGILVVEHFDAGECFEHPAGVVARFLDILKKA